MSEHTGVTCNESGTEKALQSDVRIQFETGGGDTLEVLFSDNGGLSVHSLNGNPLKIWIVTSSHVEIDT